MSGDYKNLLTVIEREFAEIELEFWNDPRKQNDDD
jgi:hypothetical protein